MSTCVDRASFKARIEAGRADYGALSQLESELRQISADWAAPMRLHVINLRRQLGKGAASTTATPTMPVKTPWWAERFNLPRPDGRPLYQYRLSTEAFEELEKHLTAAAMPSGFAKPSDDALFVLWGAEWFRRCFRGGLRRWQDLGERFHLRLGQGEYRSLADRGLRFWGIRPLILNGLNHRLLALARQGGFPVAALEDGGWVERYLENIVGLVLSEETPSIEAAFNHAEALCHFVPGGWQHQELYAVSADLALAIVELRREAQAGGLLAGLPASVWLDTHRPDWRDGLPLVVDGQAAKRLIDGLMKVAAIKGGSGSVSTTRALERIDGIWHERMSFELNGSLKGSQLSSLETSWSRLRLYPAGELARYVSGELAIVEPGEKGEWVAAASSAARAADVPLNVPALVELRGGSERIGNPLLLKNGASVSDGFLVCSSDEEVENSLPSRLVVQGNASGKYKADPLYVILPQHWRAEHYADSDIIERLEEIPDRG
ncbi:MAG: hypothetical protein JO335_07845, partial [Sphingomonas sp.]|nr:hypothetical protein [Sphingomonas sp.]